VLGERCGTVELRPRLVLAAELREQVSAHRRQQVVTAQSRFGREGVNQLERRLGAECHSDGDRAVELDDRRRPELGEPVVEGDNALPVRLIGDAGPRVAGGDGRLERVRAEGAAGALRALERGEAAADEQPVPARPVLVEQQHRLSGRADSRA
jgi:hypothetical protein